MKIEDIIIHFHKFFDYETYKVFKKAISVANGINNLRMKDILISLYYLIPYLKKTKLSNELKDHLLNLIKEEENLFSDVLKRDILIKIFQKAVKIAKEKNSLISPEILFISILDNYRNKL